MASPIRLTFQLQLTGSIRDVAGVGRWIGLGRRWGPVAGSVWDVSGIGWSCGCCHFDSSSIQSLTNIAGMLMPFVNCTVLFCTEHMQKPVTQVVPGVGRRCWCRQRGRERSGTNGRVSSLGRRWGRARVLGRRWGSRPSPTWNCNTFQTISCLHPAQRPPPTPATKPAPQPPGRSPHEAAVSQVPALQQS